jgi:isochorismate hydrolase
VVDGLSHDFRMIVPRQCVADRSELAHEMSLFDIDSKYGDVEDLDYVLRQVERMYP